MSYRNVTLYGGPLDGEETGITESERERGFAVFSMRDLNGTWRATGDGKGQSSAIYRRQGDRLVYQPPRRVGEALDSQTLAVPHSVVDIQRYLIYPPL